MSQSKSIEKTMSIFAADNAKNIAEVGARASSMNRLPWVELGRKLVECEHFTWMVGMRTLGGAWCLQFDPEAFVFLDMLEDEMMDLEGWTVPHESGWMPDVTDMLTTVCLRKNLQMRYEDNTLTARWDKKKEMWSLRVANKTHRAKCEGEVYALALLA